MSLTKMSDTDTMYVRVFGMLVPIKNVDFVQKHPNNKDIAQEMPLEQVVDNLVRLNYDRFVQVKTDWRELNEENNE